MPQLKPVPTLQELALKNIAQNIFAHASASKYPKTAVQAINYSGFQRRYSDELLQLLLNIYWDEDRTFMEKIFSKDYCQRLYRKCRDFIFNKYLTKLILKSEKSPNKYLKNVPEDLLQSMESERLTEIYYPYAITSHDSLNNLVQDYLATIVSLNLKRSGCTDIALCNILQFCPHVEYLNLSFTSITDRGMLCFCNNFHPTTNIQHYNYCSNPLTCSSSTHLRKLIIKKTDVTNVGLQCALQHLPSLRVFRFRKLAHSRFHTCHSSIPRALAMLYNHRFSFPNVNPEFATNLEELTVFAGDDVADLLLVPVLCPRLRVLNFHVSLEPEAISVICQFFSLSEVSMILLDNYISLPEGMRTFFTTRGEQITNLRLHGSRQFVGIDFISDILDLCPNLRNLHLEHFRFPRDIRFLPQDHLNRCLQNSLVLTYLESLTLCDISCGNSVVVNILSAILRYSMNLQQLRIGLSQRFKIEFVDDYLNPALAIHGFLKLRQLVLVNCDISNNMLRRIVSNVPNLQDLKYAQFSSQVMLRSMQRFASERNLCVEFSAVNNEASFDFNQKSSHNIHE